MDIKKRRIRSNSSIKSDQPWFDLEFTGGVMRATAANYKGKEVSVAQSPIPINFGVTQAHSNPEYRDGKWIYGVNFDGTYFFLPWQECPSVFLAHLAVYDPLIDELAIWEFIES